MSDSVRFDGRFFSDSVGSLADGNDFNVNPADAQTGAIEIHNISHGGSVDVKLVESSDPNTLVTDKSITLDSLSGSGISQGNQIEASDNDNLYIVITNTSGGAIDVIVTGRMVSQ